jgi:putative holliday junction resolvase
VRAGVRLGVDVGSVRVGVARSDPEGLLAMPLVTLRRSRTDLAELAALAAEHGAVEVVVGLPRTLAGREGTAATAATSYARRLVAALRAGVTVRLVDERLSTVAAARDLRASGVDSRRGRRVIDQAAAVIILQGALDAERTAGSAPGHVLGTGRDSDVGAGGAGTDVRVDE